MFLMIRNPGVVNPLALTLIGASGTRFSNKEGTVGCFGSGGKLSVALLLRKNIRPIIYAGNLRSEYFTKPTFINGTQFNRICVKYSGTEEDRKTNNRTEDLGFTLEWGVQDWNKVGMAVREFVANAIDGSIENGGSYKDVVLDVVDKPRAKRGHTSVFIEYTPEIQAVHRNIGKMFLHFGNPSALRSKLIPKDENSEKGKVLVYKKGVLVNFSPGDSVYDYNLGDELTLDESRNASAWDVQWAAGLAIAASATQTELATIIKALVDRPNVWEGQISASSLNADNEQRKQTYKEAFAAIAGDKGVVTTGLPFLVEAIKRKGYEPVVFNQGNSDWKSVLENAGVTSEMSVLSQNEKKGRELLPATDEMREAVRWAFDICSKHQLTNGRSLPETKAFVSVMDAGTQVWGIYEDGVVFLHRELAGKQLYKVALEEVVHHVTGSHDETRDLQDFLFRLIMEIEYASNSRVDNSI